MRAIRLNGMNDIQAAIDKSVERSKLILECIEYCESMDTVVDEGFVDGAHEAAAKLREHLGWEIK